MGGSGGATGVVEGERKNREGKNGGSWIRG